MKTSPIWFLVSALVAAPAPSAIASESAATVARLCEVVKERKQIFVDKERPEIIWSDGAMFEVATKFPSQLQALLSGAKDNPNLKTTIERMGAEVKKDWKDASIGRSPKGNGFRTVTASDGSLTLTVSSAYIDYLKERYPGARVCVKGEFQPVVFLVGDKVRGAAMPIRQ